MIVLNDHLKDNMEKMRRFIDSLSVSISSYCIEQKMHEKKLGLIDCGFQMRNI